jgi:Tripartite tricarboxylate transporter family receptor
MTRRRMTKAIFAMTAAFAAGNGMNCALAQVSPSRPITMIASAPALPPLASALDFPMRPVRVIVGFPPGGGVDIAARLMGQWLSERLGQPFVIENRPGAAGNIATEASVRAPADGYTLLLVNGTAAINATLYHKLSFNFVRDIVPVAGIIRVPLVMELNPSVAAKTVPDFIAFAKANPGKINFASGGNGGPDHMAGELFKIMAGVDMVHVPYRGQGPGAGDIRQHSRIDRVHQGRQPAPAGGDYRDAFADAAGRPDPERFHPGLRGEPVVRGWRAKQHSR